MGHSSTLTLESRVIDCCLLTSPSVFQSILCCASYFSRGSDIIQVAPQSAVASWGHALFFPFPPLWYLLSGLRARLGTDSLAVSRCTHEFSVHLVTLRTNTSEPTRGLVNYAKALKSAERENRSVRANCVCVCGGRGWLRTHPVVGIWGYLAGKAGGFLQDEGRDEKKGWNASVRKEEQVLVGESCPVCIISPHFSVSDAGQFWSLCVFLLQRRTLGDNPAQLFAPANPLLSLVPG